MGGAESRPTNSSLGSRRVGEPAGPGLRVHTRAVAAPGRQADLRCAHVSATARAQQYGITFWGVSDQNSWLRSYYQRADYPLLFDDNYQPKPAYCRLILP
ncbi:endo-1,4-beta-xylanase [Hymenobacter cellulosilyticus]|uniref:Endo-1,4-beta-xylanase n=1 Tax=Hymenobacter cellulosilyticus TaxID=2932248 RepID=A0A8T9QGT2_9BACT|nr:endo-1,4-beta-xylanase [Hymenobacter cellulosilyticus]UOQ75040.1 endo-1,4-beta-xylanase [Hymenobacter cellulosilyticus]